MSFVLMRHLLVAGFWEQAGHQEDQTMVRCLELSGSLPRSPEEGRGLGVDNN